MSDEGMSDEMLAVVRKDISSSGDFGEVAAHVAAALIARLDAAERERDALREALNEAAQFIEVVASADFDEIAADGGVDVGMVIQKQAATVNAPRARAALTANHSATVVEE